MTEEGLAKLRHVLDEIERTQRDGGDHWRNAVRKQVRARTLAQPRNRIGLAGGVAAAATTQGLAERAGEEVDAPR
jgi:hypothetical protein